MLSDSSPHKQLRHVVADQLRNSILEGHYRPGEWLRQEHLAQELGVSQMPVREALKELTAEGLIEHVPYRGVRVIEFSPDDIEDLYTHRAFLEGKATRLAAQKITAKEISELERLQEQMEQNFARENLATYREINRRFHQVIFTASRRGYLIRTLAQMWAAFPTMLIGNFAITAENPLPNRDAIDSREHRVLIDALKRHDAEASELAMRHHIEETGRQLVQALRRSS
jgi:DNA-binding GntR family transcriptional regulator